MNALGSNARRISRLVGTALLVLAWLGCESGSSGPELGGETNWLAWCQSDAECVSGTCVCGVCTTTCSAEQPSCAAAPGDGSCFARGSFPHAALCDESPAEGICLPACATDEDCGAGGVCQLGACSPPGGSSPDDATGGAAPSPEGERRAALAELFLDNWWLGFAEEPLTPAMGSPAERRASNVRRSRRTWPKSNVTTSGPAAASITSPRPANPSATGTKRLASRRSRRARSRMSARVEACSPTAPSNATRSKSTVRLAAKGSSRRAKTYPVLSRSLRLPLLCQAAAARPTVRTPQECRSTVSAAFMLAPRQPGQWWRIVPAPHRRTSARAPMSAAEVGSSRVF
jgi:hypothetical protein